MNNILKRISKVSLAATIVAVVALVGCVKKPVTQPDKVILGGLELIEGTTDKYQSGINDTGTFIRVFSQQNWSIELEFPNPDVQNWASLGRDSGKGNGEVWLSYSSNPDDSRDVVIKIYFDKGEKTIYLTQLGLGGHTDDPKGWLEIPETPESLAGSAWKITHYVPDRLGMRNYTVLYDTLKYYPVWVAYPMHSCYDGGSGRTDEWAYNPDVPIAYQPDMSEGMRNGYDRGHMLPSAARYVTKAANEQTFYYTNMTAQRNGLNGGVWEDLEGEIRGWSNYNGSSRDTLYVVTGALLKRVDIEDTVLGTVNCRGKQIPVPKYYYKALLMKKGNGWKAIGWWFEHMVETSYRELEGSDAVTIRELEARTGINFFANVSQSEQDAFEIMTWNSSDWGFSYYNGSKYD